jgi:hypothetical protein
VHRLRMGTLRKGTQAVKSPLDQESILILVEFYEPIYHFGSDTLLQGQNVH